MIRQRRVQGPERVELRSRAVNDGNKLILKLMTKRNIEHTFRGITGRRVCFVLWPTLLVLVRGVQAATDSFGTPMSLLTFWLPTNLILSSATLSVFRIYGHILLVVCLQKEKRQKTTKNHTTIVTIGNCKTCVCKYFY